MNQSLTVLDPSSAASDDAATLVRLFHRCELDDARELGEETLLDAGIAICSPALARVSDANRVFDASVPDDMPVEQAAQDVLNHFASRGMTCRKWAPNPSSTPAQTARLTNHLESLGYVRHASCIMRLMSRRTVHEPTTAGVTIIPARASFRHARTLAGWHDVTHARGRGGDRLLARLADNEDVLREAYALLTEAVTRGRQITPAAEWLIDNFHLVEQQVNTARQHLPASYQRELPRLTNAALPGTPRVYELAFELISHAHGQVDAETLRAFVAAYQEVDSLQLGELWAIPIMLRLSLLENMRRVVSAVTAGRRERERAAVWVDAMIEVASKDCLLYTSPSPRD